MHERIVVDKLEIAAIWCLSYVNDQHCTRLWMFEAASKPIVPSKYWFVLINAPYDKHIL